MRQQHVFEVTLVRSKIHPNEDLVTNRTAERFSIKAGGDLSANRLALDLSAECFEQARDLVSAVEVRRVINGRPDSLTTAERYRQNRARFGRRF